MNSENPRRYLPECSGQSTPNGDRGQMDDFGLWSLFKEGNESAFVLIYERYFEDLLQYGLMFSANENLVKDAVQELFIDLRKSRSRLGNTNNIKFYLFKCLKRRIVKESKKWYNKILELKGDYSFTVTYSHEQLLIDKQLNVEQIEKLNIALSQLNPRKREVIFYFFYEGLSYEEIRQMMGLSNIKSARNLLYKAISFLKEVI
ncbi:sigma-70 family RNA polymerase sigma factor [Echinicola strongylocentroti]|uniref:Sigma-70 family RNA polymerase sigma factor n=1 Tax=Echinicola strongylocentroti TaxID=1795355 RepID=A0A2Z4IPL7_9BACT|nr:sigma-70 family RNA polymerase sigma factor [Echinicola strongylocentroti]AWW32744.1 sigma-70 family RNA polymerase sigma factor [Echinicola strongylocentroti]